ncbi:putative odorant receptor 98b [Scaptodrosophila lebanonensis]|uniref:Odorant receptor n=1 Tax=Drosophila lebanonensis TaxID=7225 RepID=A0A6J2UG73_DROLE|nr:putative odorant receptor 98b [Scaptodrosophila lebanonensis]
MPTDNFLKLQRLYFKLLGFDIFASQQSWQQPYKVVCSMLALALFMPLTIVFGIQNMDDVDRLTDMLCSLFVDILALYKFGVIIRMRGKFGMLIEKFKRILSNECYEGDVYATIIAQENRREQLISRLYRNCFLLGGFLATLLPIVHMLSSYWQSENVKRELPFPSVYPWDNDYIHNYLLSYFWNICAALSVVVSSVCVDTLFCSLAHNLCALYKIAQHKMQNGNQTPNKSRADLRNVIRLYQTTLDMSRELNDCFRPLICTQFFVGSLHLGVLSFQMSSNLTEPELLFFAAFTASILVQVYIYCYCGECIMEQSRRFSETIYESPWHLYAIASPSIRRSLIISMMRSQRGIVIDGYFFEANMATFLSIVQKAMSYIALLQSFS